MILAHCPMNFIGNNSIAYGNQGCIIRHHLKIYDFIKIFRSYSDMKTFPSAFESHQLYPHNGRKTEGERKGTEGISEARYRHSLWTWLGLVLDSSQLARYLQILAKFTPSQNSQQNGSGTEGIWLVTGTLRPGALVLHFCSTEFGQSQVFMFWWTLRFTCITEGKRKGNGRERKG